MTGMSTVNVILLILSAAANVFAYFYIRWLLRNMSEVSENLEILSDNLEGFKNHVDAVHESEMYYGDTSLQELIKHSKSLTDEISTIREILLVGGEAQAPTEEDTLEEDDDG